MKIFRTLSLISAATVVAFSATCALAEPPAAAPAPFKMDSATLGRLDGLLTLCAKADAKNRARYDQYRTEMIVFAEGTPQEMRVPGSDTLDFKRARAELIEATSKNTAEELAAECSRVIGSRPVEEPESTE